MRVFLSIIVTRLRRTYRTSNTQARVEHLEQAGGQSLTSMARLSSLVFVTLAVDGFMVTYCLENISVDRASALVLFAFGEASRCVCFLF